ncbi:MAG TPA: nuclear transport factor 2 family protein [Acidimicrobiales bacterium]|nr:nuclear transport factor 2 family protein [Acidimicrobiales bacterium]
MYEHHNVKLIRRGYDCFARGDLEALREIMAPDIVWHEPGRSPLAGDHKGPDGVLAFFRELTERSGGTFEVEIVDTVADPERVVVFQRERAQRGSDAIDLLAAVDFEVHYGKITEVSVYHADTYRFDEFFS